MSQMTGFGRYRPLQQRLNPLPFKGEACCGAQLVSPLKPALPQPAPVPRFPAPASTLGRKRLHLPNKAAHPLSPADPNLLSNFAFYDPSQFTTPSLEGSPLLWLIPIAVVPRGYAAVAVIQDLPQHLP
jgi:hypothetical protein